MITNDEHSEVAITFRKANINDAPFVATVMLEAVGMQIMEEGKTPDDELVAICRRTDTLYSWTNAVIAEADGKPVAALIAYPGEGYRERRNLTFSLVRNRLSFNPETMDDETRSGEYYLDSLAVVPQWRGREIAKVLLQNGVKMAKADNLTPVLACSPDNHNAHKLYTSLGFRDNGHLFIFGEDYLRMTISDK